MAQDQDREPQESPKSKINLILHKRQTVIAAMVVVGFFLLIPLILLISSIAEQNKLGTGSDTSEEEIFGVPYVGDELIVELKESFTAQEIEELNNKFEELGVIDQEKLSETDNPEFQNYYVLKFGNDADVKHALEELKKLPQINNISPNYIFETFFTPNDSAYYDMWGLAKIDMPNAWEITQGNNNIVVAVLDTGIDYNHPDLVGKNIIRGQDFSTCDQYESSTSTACILDKPRDNDPLDDHGHGTHVAGTIGAVTNNGVGVAGVGYNVGLMAVKTMGKSSRGEYKDVFEGLEYAVNDSRVNIINMSLGLHKTCSGLPGLQELINQGVVLGKVIVVAAGNSGVDAGSTSPASCNGVVTVGATDQNDRRAQFSNYGGVVDIASPGVSILSTLLPGVTLSSTCGDQNYGASNDGYGSCNGTSMAAPHVAGVAGLLLSQNPGLSTGQVISCLLENADPISTDRNIGPRLNAFATLNACSGLAPITPLPTVTPTPTVTSGITPGITSGPNPTAGYTPQQSVINGTIFIDTNLNAVKDTGEQGYQGAEIVLSPQNSRILSNSQGNFTFDNLSAGSYVVSAYINGQNTHISNIDNLPLNTAVIVSFPIPPSLINQIPGSPTLPPSQSLPVIQPTNTPIATPTPIQTYTCRENTGDYVPQGTLQLGSLICEPN